MDVVYQTYVMQLAPVIFSSLLLFFFAICSFVGHAQGHSAQARTKGGGAVRAENGALIAAGAAAATTTTGAAEAAAAEATAATAVPAAG